MERVPIPVVVALLVNRGRVFLMQRARDRPLPGQWEFPGGKVEVGEPPVAALRRELREELGLAVGRIALFGVYSHVYELPAGRTHYVIVAYRASVREGEWSRAGRWMNARALLADEVVAGSRPIVRDLVDARIVP